MLAPLAVLARLVVITSSTMLKGFCGSIENQLFTRVTCRETDG